MSETPERGLPGGIPVPAVLFLGSMVGFGVLFTNQELLQVEGGHFSPAGMCVLAAVVTFFWLLVAIAKRPPPDGPLPKA